MYDRFLASCRDAFLEKGGGGEDEISNKKYEFHALHTCPISKISSFHTIPNTQSKAHASHTNMLTLVPLTA